MPGSHMDGSSDDVPHPEAPSERNVQYMVAPRERSPARLRRPFPTGVSFAIVKNPVYSAGVFRRFTPQQALELCKDKIRSILERHPEDNFKIGLTADLEVRLDGYEREGARTLVAVYSTDSVAEAVLLERGCIGHFCSNERCRNQAPGGEGMGRGRTPVYLYVALGGAVPPKATEEGLLFQWRACDRLRLPRK